MKRFNVWYTQACVLCALVGCGEDAMPISGTLRLIQAAGRGGEQDDGLGAVLLGQATCGTHVFVRSEGGLHAYLGGEHVQQSCIALSGRDALREFDLSIYPAHSATQVHAQLMLDPSRCPDPSTACSSTCAGVEKPKQRDEPSGGACPASWIPLDQATILVTNVLPTAPGTTGGTSSETGDTAGSSTTAGTSPSTTTTSDATSGTSDGSTT